MGLLKDHSKDLQLGTEKVVMLAVVKYIVIF